MSEQEQNHPKKQPYLSPAMLSIAADEAKEAEEKRQQELKEKERQAAEQAAAKEQPVKKQPYQPFTFVRADVKETSETGGRKLSDEEEALIAKAAGKPVQPNPKKEPPSFTVVGSPKEKKPVSQPAAKPQGGKKKTAAGEQKPKTDPSKKTASAAKPERKQPQLTEHPPKNPAKTKSAANANAKKSAPKSAASQPKRKKRKNNYTLYYLALGSVAAIVLVVLSLTVLFPIQKITVVPTDQNITLTDTQIEAFITASGIKQGDNLLRIPKASAEKAVLASSYAIDDVDIRRKLPGTAEIRVNVAQVAYALYHEGTYYVISENGRVMETGTQKRLGEDCLVVNGFTVENCEAGSYYDEKAVLDQRLELASEKFSKVKETDAQYKELEDAKMDADREVRRYELFVELMEKLSEYGLDNITRIDMELSSDIAFTYDDRIDVLLGGYTEIDYKLALAKEILFGQLTDEDSGTLNLSVPELPGFKSGSR